jgi:rhomboid protease GluP
VPGERADAAATSRLGLWILAINVLVFLFVLALDPAKGDRPGQFTPSEVALDMFGANEWLLVRGCGQHWRFLTAMFLHADLLHLLLNSVALLILIPLAALTFGAHRTTCLYFAAGLAGSLVSHLAENSSVGASGALCGLVAALAVYGRRRGGIEGRMLSQRMLGWAVLIVVFGFLMPGIDNAGHIGGFVGGALLGRPAAGVRARGGRGERLWSLAARACIAGAVAVAVIWMVPNAVRGFERREVDLYLSHAARTLDSVERMLHGTLATPLPTTIEEGPRGSAAVRDAVRAALAAARGPRAEARRTLEAARRTLRDWEAGLFCSHNLRSSG